MKKIYYRKKMYYLKKEKIKKIYFYCPSCSFKNTKVIESRESSDSIRRRRECLDCYKRFTTYEKIQISSKIVIKSDTLA